MSGICLIATIVALCLLIIYINRKQKLNEITSNIYPSYHNTNIIQSGTNPLVQLGNKTKKNVSFASFPSKKVKALITTHQHHLNNHFNNNNNKKLKQNICNTCLQSTAILNKTTEYQTCEWNSFIKEQNENGFNYSMILLDEYEDDLSTYIDFQQNK